MLRSLSELSNYRLRALDDDIGRCKDFLFDDKSWVLRYMVADTHAWLPGGEKVLLSPVSFSQPDVSSKKMPVKLRSEQIKNSPKLAEHEPISREFERKFFQHYGYGYYWMGSSLWGAYPYPEPLAVARDEMLEDEEQASDNHLRSINEILGYDIIACDGSVGHIEDVICSDKIWIVSFLAVCMNNTEQSRVLIARDRLGEVSWSKRQVSVSLSAQEVADSPEYGENSLGSSDYENRLRRYYAKIRA